jgi:hypothetical protein
LYNTGCISIQAAKYPEASTTSTSTAIYAIPTVTVPLFFLNPLAHWKILLFFSGRAIYLFLASFLTDPENYWRSIAPTDAALRL